MQVYKGLLRGVETVAIKVSTKQSPAQLANFAKEIKFLKAMHNTNGACIADRVALLGFGCRFLYQTTAGLYAVHMLFCYLHRSSHITHCDTAQLVLMYAFISWCLG